MPGIFNSSVFNNAIFNTAQVAASTGPQPIGGFDPNFFPRARTREEIREERERLGIIPAKVEAVIEKVAAETYSDPPIVRAQALHRELERKRLAYRSKYLEALRLEVERRRQDDELAIVMLLH